VSFSAAMNRMRRHLDEAKNLESYKYSKERRFLEAVAIYCDAVEELRRALESLPVRSQGLQGIAAYLNEYVADAAFCSLATDARKLNAELSAVKYCVLIRSGAVTVRHYEGEQDYSSTVEATFQKFRQGSVGHRRLDIHGWSGVNHIEAQIQERVALLFPSLFAAVAAFFSEHQGFVDQTIARFDREVQFYLAFLKYIEELRCAGLRFCYPELSRSSKEISAEESFDLALAGKLIEQKKPTITNDFFLRAPERVFVVSGPNQGGKTTFARMIGQLHFWASLGCLVPGTSARLPLVDRVFTHFEREEQITTMVGKLQDDLNRIREILESATGNSLIIMNETFSSTTLNDALFLSRKTMERISELDALCVWVTFLDELASFNEKTVSEVSTVRPENPATRTFKLERRHPDGLAYALALAEKHRVTYRALKERIRA
jgi:DNA mismatch repair protein MutS